MQLLVSQLNQYETVPYFIQLSENLDIGVGFFWQKQKQNLGIPFQKYCIYYFQPPI